MRMANDLDAGVSLRGTLKKLQYRAGLQSFMRRVVHEESYSRERRVALLSWRNVKLANKTPALTLVGICAIKPARINQFEKWRQATFDLLRRPHNLGGMRSLHGI